MDVSSGLPDRLYSTFLVKAFDDDQRIIEGIASSPSLDRQGDIMESAGAEFSLPHPLLWQHRHDSPVGHVVEAKLTAAGIRIKAQFAKAGILPEIDRAWALVKAGLVRGLSVGWKPQEFTPIKGGRFHVKRWKWMETSTVTIGANQDATISLIKSLDAAYPAAPGTGSRIPSRTPPGASGIRKDSVMTPISEQVTEAKADLQTKSARLEELITQDGTDGGLNDDETKELDALTDGVKLLTKQLGRLETLEAAQLGQARTLSFQSPSPQAPRLPKIEVKELPKGTLFARYAMAVAAGKGSLSDTIAYAKRWDPQTPEVSRYIKAVAGTTDGGSPGWGSELLATRVTGEFVELLMPGTIIGKLNLNSSPFNTRLIVQTGGGLVEWVGQTGVKPVGEMTFDELNLDEHKIAGIIVLAEELVRFSRPNAEDTVRRQMVKDVTKFMDAQFITPGVSAGANNPASVTNGVTPTGASGSDLDALYADINTALAGFDSSELGSDGVSIVTTPALARGISMLRTALGTRAEDGLTPNGGTLMGFPVVVSSAVPAGYIIFIKGDEVLLADDGRVTLDASNQATLDMSGGSTPAFSLWQRNCIGIRAERYVTWLKRREEAVAMISGAAYGPAVGSP